MRRGLSMPVELRSRSELSGRTREVAWRGRRPARRVVGAAQLAGRVHRQLGDADVDGGDAEAGGRERADRRPARHVVARHEHLARHAGVARRPAANSAAVSAVGGVALVGVDLDRRAAVDERPRGRARGARGSWGARRGRCRPTRSSTRPAARWQLVAVAAARRRAAARARPRGAGPRRRVRRLAEPTSSWSNRAIIATWSAGAASASAVGRRPARHLVVEAPAGQQRSVGAEHGGRLDVVEARAPTPPTSPSTPGLVGEPVGERRRPSDRRPRPASGGLAVEHQAALVDVAVEVDGQLRDPGQRLGDVDERRRCRRRATTRPAMPRSRSSQLVEQHAAVDLDAELAPAGRAAVGPRLDAQVRASRCGRRRRGSAERAGAAGRRHATSAPPRTTNPASATSVHELRLVHRA